MMSYSEFLCAVHHTYLEPDPVTLKWDDGEEEILDLEGARKMRIPERRTARS